MKIYQHLFPILLLSGFMTANISAAELTRTAKLTGIVPEPQQVYMLSDNKPFQLSRNSVIITSQAPSPLYNQGIDMLWEDLKAAYNISQSPILKADYLSTNHLFLCNNKQNAKDIYAQTMAILKKLPASETNSLERYKMIINNHSILISAPEDKGVFYAIQTLRQLLTQNGAIPALAISDWPDQRIRASYGTFNSMDMKTYIRMLASLKMNMAIMESPWNARGNWWYNPTGNNLKKGQEFFKLCHQYNVEPVPLIQGFGWAYGVVGIDPHCAEGIWVKCEKYTLTGTDECTLKNPNVLTTKAAPIVVESADRKVTFREGTDYIIKRGHTAAPFRKSHKPWKIARTAHSQIKDGESVLISYNYMNFCTLQTPYCPLEPRTYQIVDRVLKKAIKIYQPKYIHIGHDEVRYINRCSRSKQSGLNRDQIIALDLKHWNDTIKASDPSITMMAWSDLFIHNNTTNKQALNAVTEDTIICPWIYKDSSSAQLNMNKKLKLLIRDSKRPTLGTGAGYTNNNIWMWKEALEKYKNNPNALGFMFSYWGETEKMWSSLSFAADYMWSRQKPDRNVFDLYNAADILLRTQGLGMAVDMNKQKKNIQSRITFDLSIGKNIMKAADDLDKKINDIAKRVNKNIVPELAHITYVQNIHSERLLEKLRNLSESYKKLTLKIYKQQNKKSVHINGLEFIPFEIIDVKNATQTQDINETTYDLGFSRWLSGLEFNVASPEKLDIALSSSSGEFHKVNKLIQKNQNGKTVLKWQPEQAEKIRIYASRPITLKRIFALKKPTEYICTKIKQSSPDWTSNKFWHNIPKAEGFVTRKRKEKEKLFLSSWQTFAQTAYDDSNLYIRFECSFPDPAMLEYNKEKTIKSGSPIWEHDCVQLFIQPENAAKKNKSSFYQVIVNVKEYQLEMYHGMNKVPVDIPVKCEILQNKWICRIKIPLIWFGENKKPLSSQIWKINFGRTQRYPISDPCSAYSSWAILPPGTSLWFLQPEYFGNLKFKSK